MLQNYFIQGLVIGIIFGVPIGAIGAITIKRTILYGPLSGFISGLGCSSADLIYSCVSVFGLTLISDFMLKYQGVISMIGGVFIIVMGIGMIMKKQNNPSGVPDMSRIASFFTSSFFIAITNPATILSFLLAFSIFNVGKVPNAFYGIQLIFGIFLGTCVWWSIIAIGIGALRKNINDNKIRIINYILGGLVILFGIAVIVRIVPDMM